MFYRLLSYLPFPALYAIAWVFYLLLYHVARYRRDVVAQNLARAFPEKDQRERTALGKQFYRRLCQVAVEIIKARRMQPEAFLERVRFINQELLEQYSQDFTRSVIVLPFTMGTGSGCCTVPPLTFRFP